MTYGHHTLVCMVAGLTIVTGTCAPLNPIMMQEAPLSARRRVWTSPEHGARGCPT